MKLVRFGLLLCAGVLAFVGCSALVSSELENVSCQQEGALGPPACPVGFSCRGRKCAACAPKDICENGVDDDCNGQVDDDCGTDSGSGGALGGGGGTPGGTGGVAGTAASGATGGVAGGGSGGDGGLGATGGVGGDGSVLSRLGEPCIDTANCVSGLFCATPNLHGGNTANKVCAKPCCKSDDCIGPNNDVICNPALGGYGLCLPVGEVNRPMPGAGATGVPCTQDGDCRSALCVLNLCTDYCCVNSSSNCPGAIPGCVFQPIPNTGHSGFLCGKPSGTGYKGFCDEHADCQTKLCYTSQFQCTQPCCRKSDCGTWKCAYAGVGSDNVRVCAPGGPQGSKANGEACIGPSECASGWCIQLQTGGQFCSDACCQDSDCGVNLGCRPVADTNNDLLLICVPL